MSKDKPKFLGNMNGFTGRSFAGAVWDKDHVSPTLNSMQGGGRQPHIVEVSAVIGSMQKNTFIGNGEYSPTLTGAMGLGGGHVPMVVQTSALKMVRTEEGKRLRKAYEAHEVHHGFNEHKEAEPRVDGVCNTISMVQKDNYLLETRAGIETIPAKFQPFAYEIDGKLYLIRIRKLTPLECWRLMGFSDVDFHKATAVNSNTQLYKQAGNSIVKQVLMSIFEQMIEPKRKYTELQLKALALLNP